MVKALLLAGADSTLVGCQPGDVNENASSGMYKREYRELPEGTGKGKFTWSHEYLLTNIGAKSSHLPIPFLVSIQDDV